MKKEFRYVFQLTKLITFEVEYYTLGNNKNPYFTTSANEFVRNKRDYKSCGQGQQRLLTGKAFRFWKKWDKLHLKDLSETEYQEIIKDIEELKEIYNFIYKENNGFSFYEIVEFSKQKLK